MTTFRKILSACASLRLSAAVLLLFFGLTLIGTFLQVQEGLWASHQRIFHVWLARIPAGQLWIPFPGVLTVGLMGVINIAAALAVRIKWNWHNSGLIILHLGLLLLLGGGAWGFYATQSYDLDLGPGEKSSSATTTDLWELGLRVEDDSGATWYLQTLHAALLGKTFNLGPQMPGAQLIAYTPNGMVADRAIIPDFSAAEPAQWVPALAVQYDFKGEKDTAYLSAQQPLHLVDHHHTILRLRKKTVTLPFALTLNQFVRTQHPGTNIAKSYESHLELQEGAQQHKVIVKMNQPLRVQDYTVYQSSWRFNPTTGMEHTILSVVYNPWRTLPYYATLLLGLGLLWHVLVRRIKALRKILPAVLMGWILLNPQMAAAQNSAALPSAPAALGELPILSEGRIKPLAAHAQNLLLSLSARTTTKATPDLPSQDALSWWLNTAFYPESTREIPLFLIENPELRDALELQGQDRDRYSWSQLKLVGARLDSLAAMAQFTPAATRSAFQKELLRLDYQWQQYYALTLVLEFLRPTSVAPTGDTTLPQSFYELAQRSAEQSQRLAQVLHPAGELSPADSAYAQWFEFTMAQAPTWSTILLELYPAEAQDSLRWLNLGSEIWEHGLEDSVLAHSLRLWHGLYANWNHSDTLVRSDWARQLVHSYTNLAPMPRTALRAEMTLLRIRPFNKALGVFAVALLLALFAVKSTRTWPRYGALIANLAALGLMLGGMVLRYAITGRPPVTNLYETLVFVAFSTAAVLLAFRRSLGKAAEMLAAGAGALLLFFAQKHGANGDTMPVLAAVLDSNFWLTTHVITISLGYGLVVASGVAAHWHLWISTRPAKAVSTFKTVHSLQIYGLFFTFVGTLLGGIWADQSWGRFWGWDPKENGALLIVLWSALLLHSQPARLCGPRGFSLGAILGIPVVLFAWFGVNLLGVGLHSYGFTEGTLWGLAAYAVVQFMLIVILWVRSAPAPISHDSTTKPQ